MIHSSHCKKKEICSNCELECVDKNSVKVQQTTQETVQHTFNKDKGDVIELQYATADVVGEKEKDLFQFRANILTITTENYTSCDEEVVTCGLISIQNECRE